MTADRRTLAVPCQQHNDDLICPDCGWTVMRPRQADPPTPAGLDVKRLGAAMHRVRMSRTGPLAPSADAPAIAAEYARLAAGDKENE
jgi:hypothetical protein